MTTDQKTKFTGMHAESEITNFDRAINADSDSDEELREGTDVPVRMRDESI